MENQKKQSLLHGFYNLTPEERMNAVTSFAKLDTNSRQTLFDFQGHAFEQFGRMGENVISILPTPLGIATNFIINQKEYVIPMATEEASIIAAASYAAKLARTTGGFTATCKPSLMEGLIQLVKVPNIQDAITALMSHKQLLIEHANQADPVLVQKGGGAQDIFCTSLETTRGKMLAITLLVNVKDAMGANIINTMTEAIAPTIAALSAGTVRMCIVSNYTSQRIARASARWPAASLGQTTIDAILDAYAFACADIRRATTHNKGIMNGIDAVARATGNDTRALEAAAHSFATRSGRYMPLTFFTQNELGDLVGTIEIPVPMGIVGGITRINPITATALSILNPSSSQELGCIVAAVGLAQNFAALRALVCEGIQKGHMRLHHKAITPLECLQ